MGKIKEHYVIISCFGLKIQASRWPAIPDGCGPSPHHGDTWWHRQHPIGSYRVQLYGFQTTRQPWSTVYSDLLFYPSLSEDQICECRGYRRQGTKCHQQRWKKWLTRLTPSVLFFFTGVLIFGLSSNFWIVFAFMCAIFVFFANIGMILSNFCTYFVC